MTLINVGNKYDNTGVNQQPVYARKLIEKSPSVIGLKNSKAAVMLVLKPIESKLNILEKDNRILKISENRYLATTGLESDIQFIYRLLKDKAIEYKKTYGEEVSTECLKSTLEYYLHVFSSAISTRVIGADFMIMSRENDEFSIHCTTPDLIALKFRGCVIGSMHRKARTEIEKYDLESLDVNGLIDCGVKSFYKSFDPIVDKEFKLEIGVISDETNGKFKRLSEDEVMSYVELYKDLTVEDVE
ncbi:PSA7 [Hepatospora eriocheir]|uniref:PSA7 n=1 Tax=Hepatospora eriocheir TaxID=1081669 RepID=A0A1X0QJR1_9MICR|nr:PSA7 [Hepatospora eriocheir]